MDDNLHQVELRQAGDPEFVLKVSNSTDVHKLSHAVARNIDEGKKVVLSCLGVQTVNQAVKAIAIANGKTAPNGYCFLLLPLFHNETVGPDTEHTVIRLRVVKYLIGH